jgi:opacity protein-like surface antigen
MNMNIKNKVIQLTLNSSYWDFSKRGVRVFWEKNLLLKFGVLCFTFLWFVVSNVFANDPTLTGNDPLVIKVYPDGTKVLLKSSEVGTTNDNGAAYGGPPKIMPYTNGNKVEVEPIASEGFYFAPAIGGAVVQDVNGYGGDVSFSFNPGVRCDLSIGYRLNEWFSLEFAPGFIYNSLETITIQGSQYNVDGELIQVPLLINPILTIPTDSKWEPFLGLGVGGVYTSQSNNAFSYYSSGTTTAWNFCYSALAGVQYHLEQDISFGFIYKFTGVNQSGLNYDDVLTQSVQANATFRF